MKFSLPNLCNLKSHLTYLFKLKYFYLVYFYEYFNFFYKFEERAEICYDPRIQLSVGEGQCVPVSQ